MAILFLFVLAESNYLQRSADEFNIFPPPSLSSVDGFQVTFPELHTRHFLYMGQCLVNGIPIEGAVPHRNCYGGNTTDCDSVRGCCLKWTSVLETEKQNIDIYYPGYSPVST